jgi:4-amino-4-deoxy-L-arabinose transferase-like glycosyltransferase
MTTAAPPIESPTPAEGPEPAHARRRPPAPAVALVVASLLLALVWALVTPAFQAPDENGHFAYVQSLVDGGRLPGDANRNVFSTEQSAAMNFSNSDQTAAQPATKMEWRSEAWDAWLGYDRGLGHAGRADGGGPVPAASNPPLYYLYASLGYRAASGGDLFARMLASRVVSALLLIVTVFAAWLLAGEALRGDRLLQVAATALVGLAPMMTFLSAAITPDAMLFAAWTLALWLGVRILRRGVTVPSAAGLLAAVGVAIVVKAASYALLPGALFVLVVALHRRRPLAFSRIAAVAGAAAAGLLATAGAWFVVARVLDRPAAAQLSGASSTAGTNIRELFSYVWQYYLPRIPGQNHFPTIAHTLPAYDIWFKGVWGAFGWTEVVFATPVYPILVALTVVIVVAAGSELWRGRASADKAIGAFLAIVSVSLVAGLHWSEYHLIKGGAGNFNQGRYLLPLVGIAGIVLAIAIRRLAPSRRPLAVGGVLAGLFALQVLALAINVTRFYA